MLSLKIIIKPLSSFASNIASDTFFGAFCWLYLEKFGKEKLEKALLNEKGFLVFSNLLPLAKIPMPILKRKNIDFESKEDYAINKKLKKQSYLDLAILDKLRNNLSFSNLYLKLKENNNNEQVKKVKDSSNMIITKNTINRLTFQVLEGNLYTSEETFYQNNINLSFYLKFNQDILDFKTLKELLKNLGILGIGKDKNIGKGKFEILEIIEKPKELEYFEKANAFISLSNGINNLDDCSLISGKAMTKFSKHGREYDTLGYLKNPIQYYKAGSVFSFKEKKAIFGKYLDNVSNSANHLQSAFLLPLFICLSQEEN